MIVKLHTQKSAVSDETADFFAHDSCARQLINRFLTRRNKEKAVPLIGLADKIAQRPLGIARVITIKGRLDAIIDELLQRLAEQACAEDEKLVACEFFIDQQPIRTRLIARAQDAASLIRIVSGRTAIAAPFS